MKSDRKEENGDFSDWPELEQEDILCEAYTAVDYTIKNPKIVRCPNKPTEIVWNYKFPIPKYLALCYTCANSLVRKGTVKRKT